MDVMSELHTSHPKIINRLKRAKGHLETILRMFEEGRSCLDLAQQLHAVEKAVSSAKETLIYDHIEHCLEHCLEHAVEQDSKKSRKSLAEFKEITKYL